MFASCRALLSVFLLLAVVIYYAKAAPNCNPGTYAEAFPSVLNTIQGAGRKTILQTVATLTSVYVMGHVQDSEAFFSPSVSIRADANAVYFVARYMLDGTLMTVRSYTTDVEIVQILVSQSDVFVIGKTIAAATVCNTAIQQDSVFIQKQSDDSDCVWLQVLPMSSNPVAALDQTGVVIGVSFLRNGASTTNIKITKYLFPGGTPMYEFTTGPGGDGNQGVVKLAVRSRTVVFVGYFESTTIAPFGFVRKSNRMDYFVAALDMTNVLWAKSMGTSRYTLDVVSLQMNSMDQAIFDANLEGDFMSGFEYANTQSSIKSGYVLLLLDKATGDLLEVASWSEVISGQQMVVLNDNTVATLVSIRNGAYIFNNIQVTCSHASCFALFTTKNGNYSISSSFTWWQASTAQFAVDYAASTFFVTGTHTRELPFVLNKNEYPPVTESSVYSFTLVRSNVPMVVEMAHGERDAVISTPKSTSYFGNNFVSAIEFSSNILLPFGIENNFAPNFDVAIMKYWQNCSMCVAGTFGRRDGNVSFCSSCAQGLQVTKLT